MHNLTLLYTIAQVQEILNLSRPTINRLMKNGALEKIKIGGAVRISAESVERLIERGRD